MWIWVVFALIEIGLLCAGVVVDSMTHLAPVWVWAVTSIACFTLAGLFCIQRVRDYIESLLARFVASDSWSFASLAPLIEDVIRYKEAYDPSAMPSALGLEKSWRLDAELHRLAIPHPDPTAR